MANLFSEINSRIRGSSSRDGVASDRSPPAAAAQASSPEEPSTPRGTQPQSEHTTPRAPQLATFQSLSRSLEMATSTTEPNPLAHHPRPLPLWLDPKYAKHIVKGNFMTLSTRPKTVEEGEWMAHQIVEHYRLLWNFVRIIIDKDEYGNAICNCPKMSAGQHSYTWLNSRHEPTELPAHEYISLMQRWISGKIDNESLFPTDPSTVSFSHNPSITHSALLTGSDDWIGKRSGFPQDFAGICQTMFAQMFRVYAHLYWNHFVDPFYHLNLEKQLNSCFSHFVLSATSLDMLEPKDMEPMQPLIDLWAANGTFPPESKAYSYTDPKCGMYLMNLGTPPQAV